jgi:anthranilate synthase component 1
MFKPSLEEAKTIAETGQYRVIPLSTEMYADMVTPIDVIKKLKKASGHCFMLESAEDTKNWGRYTFLGFDPTMEITCLNGEMSINSNNSAETKSFKTDTPNKHIQEILDSRKSVKFDFLPPFTGGLVGYFAYDYAKYCEPSLKLDAADEERFNDVDLMLFDKVIAFDNYRQKVILIANINAQNIES